LSGRRSGRLAVDAKVLQLIIFAPRVCKAAKLRMGAEPWLHVNQLSDAIVFGFDRDYFATSRPNAVLVDHGEPDEDADPFGKSACAFLTAGGPLVSNPRADGLGQPRFVLRKGASVATPLYTSPATLLRALSFGLELNSNSTRNNRDDPHSCRMDFHHLGTAAKWESRSSCLDSRHPRGTTRARKIASEHSAS